MKRKPWRISDLIDLEFFFSRDEGEDIDVLAARDREIYTGLPESIKAAKPSTALLLLGWLGSMKKSAAASEDETPLPGRVWQELFSLFFGASLLLGLFSGATLAFSYLSYSGSRPINVSLYFGIFVVLQVVLFLLLIFLFAYRKLVGQGLESSFLYRLLRRLFDKALAAVSRRAVSRAGADTRMQWSARAVGVKRLQKRYGVLFVRPFFLLGQLFGVSFNVGVLAATLLKVIGSDVAFGWQTTIQVHTETVHRMIEWISLPWSWLIPASCCPTAAQVEGSKLILKDGIYRLATPDLTSWWPFLCMSVLVYGLLPRLTLLLVAIFQQRRDLANLRFDQGRCRQLIHRMRTPLVSTRAPAEGQQEDAGAQAAARRDAPEKHGVTDEAAPSPSSSAEQGHELPEEDESSLILGLIPDELFADCSLAELQQQVRLRLGYELTAIQPFWSMDRTEEEELAILEEKMAAEGSGDILLLQEAWQPPIQELLSFLRRLRETVGEEPTILIVLIGKPTAATMLTPVKKLNLQIWQQKLAAVDDPGLQLIELVK
jgi:hypothetical protein